MSSAPFTEPTYWGGHISLSPLLSASLLFHHNTLMNKLDRRRVWLVCELRHSSIHPCFPLPPPADAWSPRSHALLAEALCCERVRCLPSIWVSYRGHRFKCSSPLHAGTGCTSTRAHYVCRSVGACKYVGWGACMCADDVQPCLCPYITILYICLCATALRISITVPGFLPTTIMNMLPVGAWGGTWDTSTWLALE